MPYSQSDSVILNVLATAPGGGFTAILRHNGPEGIGFQNADTNTDRSSLRGRGGLGWYDVLTSYRKCLVA